MNQKILQQEESSIRFTTLIKRCFLAIIFSLFAVSTQAQWANVGSAGFSAGNADYITMALDGSTPYVAYRDLANGDKATVMKFNGTNWVTVGNAGFSAGIVTWTSIAIHNSTPYVLYRDWPNSGKATVMKFDGVNWVTVGTPGFSTGNSGISYATLAFSGSIPYVAFSNLSSSNKATVMKFNGTSWQTVGPAVLTSSGAIHISLAFEGSTPHISFRDGANGNKATVMKFDGTNWVNVGNAGFSAGWVEHTSLAFEGATPYVAYKDVANSSKTTVMKFDGSNWINVGSPGFSSGNIDYTSLAMNGSTPYVAYLDFASGPKVVVKKFNGSSWVNVGNAGFSAGFQTGPKIVINGTELYVAYTGTTDKATVAKTTICDPITSTINQSICQGSSYMFNGIPRTTAGTYVANLTQACGSDSVVTLNLTVMPTTISASMATSNPTRCGLNGSIALSAINAYTMLATNTFSGAIASPFSTTGSATIDNGEMQLTAATNSLNGACIYTPISTPSGFTALFDLNIYNSPSGNEVADGISFNYGNLQSSPIGHEDGMLNGNGLVIRFKEWQTQRVEVLYNGTIKGTYDIDLHNPTIRKVRIAVLPNGKLDLSIGDQVVCTNLDLGTAYNTDTKTSWKFAWGSRTGGSNNRHAIDNIEIYSNENGIAFTHDNWTSQRALPFFNVVPNSYTIQGGNATCSSIIGTPTLAAFDASNFTTVSNNNNPTCTGRAITVTNTLVNDTLVWSDFASRPTLSNLGNLGNATFSNGSVQLTDITNGQNGRIIFPQTPNAGVFTATFKARVWDGNNADGFSFNYGQIDNELGAEGGMMNNNTPGLSVGFPTWNTNSIVVKYKNNVLTTVPNTGSGGNRASFFTPVEISVNEQYQLTLKWNGTTYINNYDLVANSTYETDAKTAWQFGWAARTGGQFDRHQLDDILVVGKPGLLYSYDGGTTFETNTTKIINNTNAVTLVVKADGTCNSSTVSFPAITTTTPTFTQVAPICAGASLSALPTTSLNGIIGSWSPAINNTTTTLYTFTPTAGQCANATTMTILVNTIPSILSVSATPNTLCVGDSSTLHVTTPLAGVFVSTLAGSGLAGSVDDNGVAASFNSPAGVATDAAGNVFVADVINHKIRKITPSGVVTTFAGSGLQGSTDGNDTAASFNRPFGITTDAAGDIYVADQLNNKIRKITPSGVVSAFAGSGLQGSTNGNGAAASFAQPTGVTTDAAGNVYVADFFNQKVRKITPSGDVTTFAGSGSQGSANGNGTAASFFFLLELQPMLLVMYTLQTKQIIKYV